MSTVKRVTVLEPISSQVVYDNTTEAPKLKVEGSVLDPKITSSESNIRKSRKEHADSLSEDGTVVIRDIIFNTPSGAANFIRGGACNGKTYWRTASDPPLREFISYRKDNSDN